MGAADVVPFIPIEGVSIEDCVAMARHVGAEIWKRYQIPVYLYEAAATAADRQNLETIRRGQFEGIRAEIATNPARKPDFGDPRVHPTAGVTAVGDNNSEGRWLVREGGVKPGFGAEEVARARLRPVTSGECPASVAEIAAVGLEGRPIRRLYLLDEESRRLTLLPARGLTEDRIAAFANDAGLGFRAYSITTGGRVHPDVLCDDVLFPRSSRQVRLVRRLSEDAEWQWTGRP